MDILISILLLLFFLFWIVVGREEICLSLKIDVCEDLLVREGVDNFDGFLFEEKSEIVGRFWFFFGINEI